MNHTHATLPRLGLAVLLAAGILSRLAAAEATTPAPNPSTDPFPDFGFMVSPEGYTGPVFQLSQDYPKDLPAKSDVPAFFAKLPAAPFSPDFEAWRDYMMAVRDYCFEGNTSADPAKFATDWQVQNNPVRKWYHIPWQHYGASGREGVHGLTREAPVANMQLSLAQGVPAPGDNYQTYAVGFFNSFGGYTIGKVWADHMNPDLSWTTKPHGFPEGTVICKLLFVDVPASEVPFLVNPVQWTGYIQETFGNTARSLRTVSLIQMDIAVRDDRAPLGWLFGTFQYNGAVSQGPAWKNLMPVGIMWGNDPKNNGLAYTNPNPVATRINPELKETSINADTRQLPPTHLGWNGRLNGPVDNPQSSCLSCHMTAEYPALSPMSPLFQANPPAVGSKTWMRWFENLPCATPFDPGAQSADFSLQLAIGVTNFYEWAPPKESGLFAAAYTQSPNTAAAKKPKLLKAQALPPGTHTFPIVRDLPQKH
ncbi:MAG: hypothetical protein HYV96_08800 [Opitutae bacterium]|nr:hypothetical protein [Opitutae bacterium]